MSELKISEAGSVQFPMLAHAAAIGWAAIPPEVAKQKRGGEAGMMLLGHFRALLTHHLPNWRAFDVSRRGHLGGGSRRGSRRPPSLHPLPPASGVRVK